MHTELLPGGWPPAMATTAENWGPWGMHMMWGSWGIGMILMMLWWWWWWVVLIAGIVMLLRWLVTTRHPGRATDVTHHADTALDILKKRYARGEITKQEFEAMRQDLQAEVGTLLLRKIDEVG
jgi:putative membrane protein